MRVMYAQTTAGARHFGTLPTKDVPVLRAHDLHRIRPTMSTGEEDDKCCEHPDIHEEGGFFVCVTCGAVHDVVIDSTPRRAFTAEEMRNRTGNEPVINKIGPRTMMQGSHDAKGKLLSAEQQFRFKRLAKIHRSLVSSYERNLFVALPSMEMFQEQLRLPDIVVKDVLRIYTRAVREKLTLGRTNDAVMGAAILAAVRLHNVPRSLKEIIERTGINRKKAVHAFRLVVQQVLPKLNLKIQPFSPIRYVDKYAEELGVSLVTRNATVSLLQNCMKKGLRVAGKDPRGIVAAAIYLAGKALSEKHTQHTIARQLKITEVTLRSRIKDIYKYG